MFFMIMNGGSNATGEIVGATNVTDVEPLLLAQKRVRVESTDLAVKAINMFINHNQILLLPDAAEPHNIVPRIPSNIKLQSKLITACLNDPKTTAVHVVDIKLRKPLYTMVKLV